MNARSVLQTSAGKSSIGSKGRNKFLKTQVRALGPGWTLRRGIIVLASSQFMSLDRKRCSLAHFMYLLIQAMKQLPMGAL